MDYEKRKKEGRKERTGQERMGEERRREERRQSRVVRGSFREQSVEEDEDSVGCQVRAASASSAGYNGYLQSSSGECG